MKNAAVQIKKTMSLSVSSESLFLCVSKNADMLISTTS